VGLSYFSAPIIRLAKPPAGLSRQEHFMQTLPGVSPRGPVGQTELTSARPTLFLQHKKGTCKHAPFPKNGLG